MIPERCVFKFWLIWQPTVPSGSHVSTPFDLFKSNAIYTSWHTFLLLIFILCLANLLMCLSTWFVPFRFCSVVSNGTSTKKSKWLNWLVLWPNYRLIIMVNSRCCKQSLDWHKILSVSARAVVFSAMNSCSLSYDGYSPLSMIDLFRVIRFTGDFVVGRSIKSWTIVTFALRFCITSMDMDCCFEHLDLMMILIICYNLDCTLTH